MTSQRLVLFDIDGTLLHGGSLWKDSFQAAWLSTAGIDPVSAMKIPVIQFAGKTDGQICLELLEASGHPTPDPEQFTRAVLAGYVARARAGFEARRHEVQALPGVHAALERLSGRPEVCVALLTGNVEAAAHLKLSAIGLGSHFPFGAFADDSWDRYRLPPVAVQRAFEKTGREFRGKQVVIIGDTVHDVRCGAGIGARAIAVGTGPRSDWAALKASGPDAFLEDLADTEKLLHEILS